MLMTYMDMTTEEILAGNKNFEYVRTDRNGTRIFTDCTCRRCGGSGEMPYHHIEGGVCFECNGHGISNPHEFKVYTHEYSKKLEERRAAKQAKEIEKKKVNRGNLLLKAGFGCEDGIYVIYRVLGNTFSVKDQLKELGCKFNYSVNWFSATPLDGFETQRLTEADALVDCVEIEWKPKEEIPAPPAEPVEAGEFLGEVGDKITFTATLSRDIVVDGYYGTKHIYLFKDSSANTIVWNTQKGYEIDESYTFTGTIKELKVYNGINQTVVTRCRQL